MTATKGTANAKTRVAAPNKAKGTAAGKTKPKSRASVQASARGVQRRGVAKTRTTGKQGNNTTSARSRVGRPPKTVVQEQPEVVVEKLETKDIWIVSIFLVVLILIGFVLGAIAL